MAWRDLTRPECAPGARSVRSNRAWNLPSRTLIFCGPMFLLALAACGGGGGSSGGIAAPPPPSGTIDGAFGTNGLARFAFPNAGDDKASAVAIQADGRIVLVGSTLNGTTYNFAVARFDSSGQPDASFNGDGLAETDIAANADDFATAVAIQSDGKIVVTGTFKNASSNEGFAVARYETDGSLDKSFGTLGIVKTRFGLGSTSEATAVAIQTDGKIVVAGTTTLSGIQDFAMARYNADGTPDLSFNLDGKVTTDFNNGYDTANALLIQSDGKIVLIGQSYNSTFASADFALARYLPDGSLDSTGFGTAGRVTGHIGTFRDIYLAAALQSDGKILAAGYTRKGALDDFVLARYNTDGTLDSGFGDNASGYAVTDFTGTDKLDWARAIALQSDGKIVVAGYTDNGTGQAGVDIAVARYTANGVLDNNYGSMGKVQIDIAGDEDQVYGAALQADGTLVLAGFIFSAGRNDFMAIRLYP